MVQLAIFWFVTFSCMTVAATKCVGIPYSMPIPAPTAMAQEIPAVPAHNATPAATAMDVTAALIARCTIASLCEATKWPAEYERHLRLHVVPQLGAQALPSILP